MLQRPPGHFTSQAPLPLHSTEHPIPVHVTTHASLPSQMQVSPGAQDFVVDGPTGVPPSLAVDEADDSDEHAASTSANAVTEKDFMAAS